MANPIQTSEDLIHEHEWIAEIEKLLSVDGQPEIYALWRLPDGTTFRAIGCLLQADEQAIELFLSPQSDSGFGGAALQFSPPKEEHSRYRKIVDTQGNVALEVTYPMCTYHRIENFRLALFRIATNQELLFSAGNEPLLQ